MIKPHFEAQLTEDSGRAHKVWADWFIALWNALGAQNSTLTATATLDFTAIAAAGTQTLTVTVTGARVGDDVTLGLPTTVDAGIVFDARVTANDTVTVRAQNITAGAINPASATYRVTVRQF